MDVNDYGRQLRPDEIEAGAHRELVGGLWDELGALQLAFMKDRGLAPGHRLLDVGCGALRGGLHFIRYLDAGRYCGMDINASLLDAGRLELAAAGLAAKAPHLLVDDRFRFARFAMSFDFALAVSVFTHLPINFIIRCLVEIRGVLRPQARFYATFFEAPARAHVAPITHPRGGMVTFFDDDPYHYSREEIAWMAEAARMEVEYIGDWGHPRDQRMLAFACRR
ncbi:MAG: class I SAM-dependent methyltransferase [Burkholderiales bacterium]|nr:class I SAM-dependent methyltransferase [Burkholderiales bacterium]